MANHNQIAALGRSCFFCDGSGQSNSHWRRMRTRQLFMLLSAFDWTAATVCWLVLATNCCKGCKSFRMLPLVWWQEPEDRSIWVRFSVIFTGYQYDSGSSSRQQFWRTNVSTSWPQSTSRCTASQCQLSPADVSGLLTPVDCMFPAPGRATATAVSPSRDCVRGTVFLLNSEHQTLGWTCSDANWRHFCLTCSCDCSTFAAFSDLALYKYP